MMRYEFDYDLKQRATLVVDGLSSPEMQLQIINLFKWYIAVSFEFITPKPIFATPLPLGNIHKYPPGAIFAP